MFPLLHDRTRRRLCRGLFLLFGLLPTSVVLAWSAVINGESYQAAFCQKVSSAIGCDVQISSLSYKRPEIILLDGLQLVDPETSEVLFSSQHTEIRQDEESISIIVFKPELQVSHCNWWYPILERRLRLNKKSPAIHLSAAEIILSWQKEKQTLKDCTVDFNSFDQGNRAQITFCISDAPSSPIQLQFDRFNPQQPNSKGRPTSSFELNTGATPLPCSLLAVALERENPFGSQSTFQGIMRGNDSPTGWFVEIVEGFINQIDVASLASRYFTGDYTGIAQIELRHALFHRGQAEQLECMIKAGRGSVSQNVLEAGKDALRLRERIHGQQSSGIVQFDQFAAEFKLMNAGLAIFGRCDGFQDGTLLQRQNESILLQPGGPLTPWWRW